MTAAANARALERQRAHGAAAVAFARRDGATRLADLRQAGALRVLFPKPEPGAAPTAVLANIGGGIAGGDRLDIAIGWGAGTDAVATTQAAEKVYRALDAPAVLATRLAVGAGATAHWLPQETILFDGSRLERSLDVTLEADATLLAAESLVFGRTARGERVASGRIVDRWRVRRAGRLVFADAFELDGAVADRLGRRAVGDGAVACATVLLAAPDAESRLDAARAAVAAATSEAGVSAFDGCLVARLVARTGAGLRHDVLALITALGRRAVPRVFAF